MPERAGRRGSPPSSGRSKRPMAKKKAPGRLEKVFGIGPEEGQQFTERMASLTPREREVIRAMVDGLPSRKIAEALGISIKTLDIHRANVRRKLGLPPIGFGKVF